ncbi:MAG: glycosyltransferase family 4 protein [Verrucomicrobiota bacterium]
MRIVVLSRNLRLVGGIEAYLNGIIPALAGQGHEMALCHEVDEPADRGLMALPPGTRSWSVAGLGADHALAELASWRPDLIFTHGLLDTSLEAKALRIAPAVFFAHSYYGTCISGGKTFKYPAPVPCSRRFGWRCLLHYYPHHCGGWNPVTMWQLYFAQSRRLKVLSAYRFILTNSEHMRSEFINHGFAPDQVKNCSFFVPARPATPPPARISPPASPWRLLFLGRMDILKGGHVLLEALPLAQAALGRPLCLTFAGDGPERSAWETRTKEIHSQNPSVRITFAGWVNSAQRDALLAETDLLVVPSLWPEPFGQVGLEAGWFGVPVAAFDVGGISDWLTEGLNGRLAPGNPPTAGGLAEAIIWSLRDPVAYKELSQGALRTAQQFSLEAHLARLAAVFEQVLKTVR